MKINSEIYRDINGQETVDSVFVMQTDHRVTVLHNKEKHRDSRINRTLNHLIIIIKKQKHA